MLEELVGDLEYFRIVDFIFLSYLGCVIYNDIVLENDVEVKTDPAEPLEFDENDNIFRDPTQAE